ncbi:hypothetical protein VNO77_00828 [Canavalia gladiata]|uniref:Uncharacterized protein n=1 Tax=Canavalia gladiata TaxID=3824 RepID=A0AAN9MUX5_CANGL
MYLDGCTKRVYATIFHNQYGTHDKNENECACSDSGLLTHIQAQTSLPHHVILGPLPMLKNFALATSKSYVFGLLATFLITLTSPCDEPLSTWLIHYMEDKDTPSLLVLCNYATLRKKPTRSRV